MSGINEETSPADQQITRMDQDTSRTDQETRMEEESAMTLQERNRIEQEVIGTEMNMMEQEQNLETITQSHAEMEVESEPTIQMGSIVTLVESDERHGPQLMVPQEQETHYFTNRNTHTSAGQASIEQNVLVGNSSQVFYPFNSEEEEYELQNNLVQSETRLVHQRLLEDDFPIFVPANPQEQESNYVSMQNNHSSCQGGIVEENVTPEGDITVIFSNQN